jgi:hypothetical protein
MQESQSRTSFKASSTIKIKQQRHCGHLHRRPKDDVARIRRKIIDGFDGNNEVLGARVTPSTTRRTTITEHDTRNTRTTHQIFHHLAHGRGV